MFKRVKGEVIRCVIGPEFVDQFEDLGFVQNVDALPEKEKRVRRTKKQIELDEKSND